MRVSVCPCKGCDSRYAGCHAKCQAYKDWRMELNQRKAEKRAYDHANNDKTEAFYNRRKYHYPLIRRDLSE